MRTIEAYQAADGQIFTDERKAEEHDIDLIGAELDALVFHVLKLDASKSQTLKGILGAIKERKTLHSTIKLIDQYLSHSE